MMQSTMPRLNKQADRKMKIPASLRISLFFVFIIGFIPQFLGILSLTSTNIIVLFFLLLFSVRSLNARMPATTVFFLATSFYIFMAGIITESSPTSLMVYFYYLLTTHLSLKCARLAVEKRYLTQEKVFKYLPIFLCLQISFGILQNILSVQISQISKMPVSPVDVASGTFYLTSDASLGFFCLISSIFAFATNQATKTKYLTLFLCAFAVSLTDSKATQLVFLATFFSLIVFDILSKVNSHKTLIAFVIPFAVLAILIVFFENFYWVQSLVNETLTDAYDKRFASIGASRLAPIGEMLYGDTPFFGHGLLAYYNPIDKNWLYNSGSSLFYTIFIDCGLLATILVYSFFLYFIYQHEKRIFYIFLYFSAFFSFSFFNFSLTDIAAIFALGSYLNLQQTNPRRKNA